MGLGAIALVLLSAVLHVGWNLRSRQQRPTAAWFALSLLASMVFLSPGLALGAEALPALVAAAWPSLVGTALFSTIYNVALASAYRSSELSLVYPLARSLAPLWVALFGLLAGRAGHMGWGVAVGVPVIVLGCGLLPMERWTLGELGRWLERRATVPLGIALATAGYTLCDDQGVRAAAAATGMGTLETAGLYACVHAVVTSLAMLAWVAASAAGRAELGLAWREHRVAAAGVGLASYLSYGCVLAAMGLAQDVSYVAAFRQVGIPLSVLAGVLLLNERVGSLRAVGTILVTAGLVCIALG